SDLCNDRERAPDRGDRKKIRGRWSDNQGPRPHHNSCQGEGVASLGLSKKTANSFLRPTSSFRRRSPITDLVVAVSVPGLGRSSTIISDQSGRLFENER